MACGIFPRPGIDPMSPALAGRFLTTGRPGKAPTRRVLSEQFPSPQLVHTSHEVFFPLTSPSPTLRIENGANQRRYSSACFGSTYTKEILQMLAWGSESARLVAECFSQAGFWAFVFSKAQGRPLEIVTWDSQLKSPTVFHNGIFFVYSCAGTLRITWHL